MKLGGKLSLVAGATQSSEASSTKASDEYDMHSHPQPTRDPTSSLTHSRRSR